MCGINGIFSQAAVDRLSERIQAMNAVLLHRGPDMGAIKLLSNHIALGHRRLAIIDVAEQANQPMVSQNKRYWIVFNGEIYNFKEIKSHFSGYAFRTHGDTEVILAAIELHGIDWFLSRANGMFAIGLVDLWEKKLYLIRDRCGIKPLYYSIINNQLIFSSEIKGILASGLVNAHLNHAAIDDYLAYRYVREPYTFFIGIYQVPAAHYLVFDDALTMHTVGYWQLPEEFNNAQEYHESSILEAFQEKLDRAVNLRLISDVPVGSYLSGGVDSSLISAMAAKNMQQSLNTYSIGFPELNEFEYAREVATQYHTNHHEILLDNKIYLNLDQWRQLIAFKDAPLSVPNEIALAFLSKELKKNITVVLSGEGADELMGGYGRIYRLGFEYVNKHTTINFYEYFCRKYEYVHRDLRNDFLNDLPNYRQYFDSLMQNQYITLTPDELVFRFFHQYHIKSLLQRLDTATMCYSVEARVPFLDYELIEFAYQQIPYDLKLKWHSAAHMAQAKNLTVEEISEQFDTPKYLLKKLAERYLPYNIVYRKKTGFPIPLSQWYHDLGGLAKEILPHADWLRHNKYLQLMDALSSNQNSGQLLWMFINLELFIQEYFNKDYIW